MARIPERGGLRPMARTDLRELRLKLIEKGRHAGEVAIEAIFALHGDDGTSTGEWFHAALMVPAAQVRDGISAAELDALADIANNQAGLVDDG